MGWGEIFGEYFWVRPGKKWFRGGELVSARKLELVLTSVKNRIWIGLALRPFLPERHLSDVSLMSGA